MLPTHHAAATALAALPLLHRGWPISKVIQFAAAAVLIDADHYASYAWKIGDLSLPRAYWFHRRRSHHPYQLHRPAIAVDRHRPLHAPALLAVLVVLARRWPVLWPVVAGMLFHRALDYAWSVKHSVGAVKRGAGASRAALSTAESGYEGTAYQRTLK